MWKASLKTVLIAASFATLGTGCTVQDLIDFLESLPPIVEPPSPPPVQDCEEELDLCLTTGVFEDDCFRAYDECLGIEPPPPVEPCEQELEWCLEDAANNGMDPDICFQAFDECVEPPPIDDCEEQLDACLQNGPQVDEDPIGMMPPYDPCWEQYEQCIDEEPPPPPVDVCEEELDDCLNGLGGSEPGDPNIDPDEDPGEAADIWDPAAEECYEQYDICMGWNPVPEPNPCEDEYRACLEDEQDLQVCDDIYNTCMGYDDQPVVY